MTDVELSLSDQSGSTFPPLWLPTPPAILSLLIGAHACRHRCPCALLVLACGPGLWLDLRLAALWPARIGANSQGEGPRMLIRRALPCERLRQTARVGDPSTPLLATAVEHSVSNSQGRGPKYSKRPDALILPWS